MAEPSYLMRQPRLWLVTVAALCAAAMAVIVWQLATPSDQAVLSQEGIALAQAGPSSADRTEAASTVDSETNDNFENEAETAADTMIDGGSDAADKPVALVVSSDGGETVPDSRTTLAGTDTTAPTPPAPTSETTAATSETTTIPQPTPSSTATPASASGRFATLPPGSALPSGSECASRVRPVAENVPENAPYNQKRGQRVTGTYFSTNSAIAKTDYEARIDGNFTGSTDEIIQWASCKWGFDEDHVRATVYTESTWYAGKLGDCGEQTHERTGGAGGCASVGLIQVRSAETGKTHHPGVYPIALESSAMNLDYALAIKRLCFEGLESWLAQTTPAPGGYKAGDEWNCMGRWFSGNFGDGGAQNYIAEVRRNLDERPWDGQWVGCPTWRDSFHCSGINRPRIG